MIRVTLDKDRPIVTARNKWVRTPEGDYRSGNVLLRPTGGRGTVHANWLIFVMVKGRWVWVHPKSRPYGYGHPGQAKIGASHCVYPLSGKVPK